MRKNKEKVYLSMALVLLMTVSIFFYALYIRQQIYYEGTRAMLETYEQVNKTFTMFAQRNWNVLTDWGGYLREMAAPETATQWKDFEEEKKTWNYSDFYMANENGDYWTVDGREGLGSENIQAVFTALQVAGEPIVSSYTATSGVRKVVFAVPVEPITMSGVTYTSLAVSYDNDTIEEMIGGRAYGGRSDCYIIHPNGDIMLSEEPKSEITAWMENLFDYLETNTEVNETCLREMQEQTLQGGSGSVPYRFKGRNYYLVYQPVGFQDLTIVGIVERNVVDAGMRKVQCVTIFLLAFLALAVVAALVRSIKMDLRFVLAEQEEAFHRESTERQKTGGPCQHRRPDRPFQREILQRDPAEKGESRGSRLRCSIWIWTASNPSTTPTATMWATSCSRLWPGGCGAVCGARTTRSASAAMSLPSSSTEPSARNSAPSGPSGSKMS